MNRYMGINGMIYKMSAERHSEMAHPENFTLMDMPKPPLLTEIVKPKRKYKKRAKKS
jgi:hypothetical protein